MNHFPHFEKQRTASKLDIIMYPESQAQDSNVNFMEHFGQLCVLCYL
jgi:hypothetical protein